jgi:23S rRNA (guanosine2251-2'-O)-methyltransferase
VAPWTTAVVLVVLLLLLREDLPQALESNPPSSAQHPMVTGHPVLLAAQALAAFAFAAGSWVFTRQALRRPDPLLVALDEVTDPMNLGAVCRTAEAVGATGVIIPERRAVDVTPSVCKASAGAVEHLPIARVRNLADFLADAKQHDCWVYGAAAGARTPYRRPDYSGGIVLVLGAEGKGLRPRVASMCDDLVALPLQGRIASLNVSVTAAVLLYEMLQQRLDAST